MQQVSVDMAVVKEQVKTMTEKLDKHIESHSNVVKDIYAKLTKYDIIFGKAGIVMTAVLFILTVILTNVVAYLRELFTRN